MEQNLLSDIQRMLKNQTEVSLKSFSIARSLIVNPSTSDQTISHILKTLETLSAPVATTAATNSQFYLLHVTTLLCEISAIRCSFSSLVTTILHSLSLHCPAIPPSAAGLALSTLVSVAPAPAFELVPSISEMTEGLFLSLCFGPCVPVRQRLLLNAIKFDVRPSLLLMVLLGFTKDPYPCLRKAALDGLIGLGKCIVIEDRGMAEGCYSRAVELLFDTEECVRCSAVQMVSEWGKFLVTNSEESSKRDWSDALYVQLCSMVRDMSASVRIEAFNGLSKVGIVSDYILMQTLSKKVLPINKEKKISSQLSGKHFNLSASRAAGTFIHGLEDEFYEVRSSACYSLRMPAILSPDFAAAALGLLMDVLNDDSIVVRLQALETMHHMAAYGNLKVQETHMHMFLGTLVDMTSSIRFTARKVLRLANLHELPLFKLVVDSVIQSLELYPYDEPDVLALIFDIGRNHGSFAVSFVKEIFSEIKPSSDNNWDFSSSKSAAWLVIAISAPLSHGKQQLLFSLPPIIFSYAVTMLGRISHGLTEVMNQNTLLAYLSHCSRSTGVKPSEDSTAEDDLPTEINHPITSSIRLDMVHDVADLLEVHDDYVKLFFANIEQVWHLTKFGCIREVVTTLRSWKDELATLITDPCQSDSILTFTSQYLRVVKLLSKAWWHVTCPSGFVHNMGDLGNILQKLERRLRELQHRFIGLSKEEELHIQELILVTCVLRLSINDDCFALKRLHSTKSHVMFLCEDQSIEPSRFVIELITIFKKNDPSFNVQDSLEFFSWKQLVFCGKLRYIKAEVDIKENNWLKPLPFVAGLPVGILLKISLHNTPNGTKLWLMMTHSKNSKQYVFIDLKNFEGDEKMRNFTFIAPFYRTPKVNSFILRLSIGMECIAEEAHSFRAHGGPKHELVYLCKEKEVFLSLVGKNR